MQGEVIIFLKMDGVAGDSAVKGFVGQIELDDLLPLNIRSMLFDAQRSGALSRATLAQVRTSSVKGIPALQSASLTTTAAGKKAVITTAKYYGKALVNTGIYTIENAIVQSQGAVVISRGDSGQVNSTSFGITGTKITTAIDILDENGNEKGTSPSSLEVGNTAEDA